MSILLKRTPTRGGESSNGRRGCQRPRVPPGEAVSDVPVVTQSIAGRSRSRARSARSQVLWTRAARVVYLARAPIAGATEWTADPRHPPQLSEVPLTVKV